jgi:outer membrane protein assembly factor BamB
LQTFNAVGKFEVRRSKFEVRADGSDDFPIDIRLPKMVCCTHSVMRFYSDSAFLSSQAVAFAITLILLAPSHPANAADQPQWGERFSRNMISAERGLPDSFDPATGRNINWTARLGSETHSSPIVAGGRVYIGTNNNEPRDPRHHGDRGVLMCFDEKTGAFQWQLVVPKINTSVYWDWPNAGICSPPTIEGDRVYIVSNRGEVMCLDVRGMANGNGGPFLDEARHSDPSAEASADPSASDADIIWLFDLIKETGVRQHDSAHASILLDGPFLYVNTSNGVDDTHRKIASPDAPSLVVLDKATGRLMARDDEHIAPYIFHSTWSSPSLGFVHGRPLIFFAGGNGTVYAFEPLSASLPRDGTVRALKKVWQCDCDPSAPKQEVHRYNSNRQQSPSNIFGMPVFYRDRIYVAGGGDLWWGKNEAWLKCIDATKSGDVTARGVLWSAPLVRHTMTTPAIANGLVFATDCAQVIHCFEAETGAVCWTHEAEGEMWASPLVADGKVYVGTRRGDFWILAAEREKRVLGRVHCDAPISGTVTAANGVLYVATMTHLYAIAQPGR